MTYHNANRSPFLFLKLKAPLPALSWMPYGSADGNIDALSMPKIGQSSTDRPKGDNVHNVENGIV